MAGEELPESLSFGLVEGNSGLTDLAFGIGESVKTSSVLPRRESSREDRESLDASESLAI